jgi:hypothetical protein
MSDLFITRRPIVLETGASVSALTDILGRIEGVSGLAALYGITDPVQAKRFAAGSVEADFAGGYYRRGFAGSNSLTSLPAWTFVRAGVGTSETAGGGVRTFATGAPRITDRGLLVERAATNHLPYSQELNRAEWTKGGSAVVTADYARGPDDTMTADRVQLPPTTSYVSRTAGSNLVAGQPCTFSFFGRGPGVVGMRSGATAGATALRTLTTNIARYSMTFNGAVSEVFQLANAGLVSGASADLDMAIWGCQVEAGSVASSYVPTRSAAATRAKDEAGFSVASGVAGGVFIEFDFPAHLPPTDVQAAFSWTDGAGTNLFLFRSDAGALVLALNKPSGDEVRSVVGYAGERRVKAFVGFGDGQVVWTVDGVERPSATNPLPLNLTTLKIGHYQTGGGQLDGTIRRVLVLDYLPTAPQRIAMTGV